MLKAGSTIAHGINSLNAFGGTQEDELYKRSSMTRFRELKEIVPQSFQSYSSFNVQTMKDGSITRKEKELIAIAASHATGCVYCIESHTKKAKRIGISLEEMAEAVFIAVALKAGSSYYHSVNMLCAYEK
jgi:AhpD family alkylhydroperoxidase